MQYFLNANTPKIKNSVPKRGKSFGYSIPEQHPPPSVRHIRNTRARRWPFFQSFVSRQPYSHPTTPVAPPSSRAPCEKGCWGRSQAVGDRTAPTLSMRFIILTKSAPSLIFPPVFAPPLRRPSNNTSQEIPPACGSTLHMSPKEKKPH